MNSWCIHKRLHKSSLIIEDKSNCTEITILCDDKTKVTRVQIKGKWKTYVNTNIHNLFNYPFVNGEENIMSNKSIIT